MDRYDNLDLECEASVADRAAMFGGMFKRSSKHVAEPQDILVNSELSNSTDSQNNPKGKGGVFKGVMGKSTKSVSEGTPSQEKTGVLGGILKRNPHQGHSRSESQDNFSMGGDLNGSSDSLSDNNSTKEKGSRFGAMFKKSNWTKSQDDLSVSSEKSGSSDNLSEGKDTKEKGGMFGGVFKNPKSLFTRSQSREDLTSDLSVRSDNLSEKPRKASLSVQSGELSASSESLNNKSSKEKTGILGGILKRSPKPAYRRADSQEDLTSDLSLSSDNLSEKPRKDSLSVQNYELSASNDSLNNNKKSSKEKTGMLGGILKRSPKPSPRRRESQDTLSLDGDLSNSNDSLSADTTKEKSSKFGGMFKGWSKGANSQSQEDLSAPGDASGRLDNLSGEKEGNERGGVFGGVFKKHKRTKSREDLTADSELSTSTDNLTENTSKGGVMGKILKHPFNPAAWQEKSDGPAESIGHTAEEIQAKKQEKGSDSDGEEENVKQNKITGAMMKLNPFRSANKKDVGQAESDKEVETQGEDKSKPVKSGPKARERMDQAGQPAAPVKPAKEDQSDDEVLTEERRANGEEVVKITEPKAAKVKKPKRHNPFMPRAADKAPSDDEGLDEVEPLNTAEGNAEEEGTVQAVRPKPQKAKKHNPFLQRVKGRPKKNTQDESAAAGDTSEDAGANRSLFDRLEDFRIDREGSNDQDVEGLMEWWSTVEEWEDMPQVDDMTEKEEAKAFALTAEKVQKGIRVFNKLFSERAESLWQHVIDLNEIADNLDRFNKKTKIAQITGGSTSAIGGVATIAGLALAPVTFGTSLIVTAVGLGVATAGGLTSAGAGISNQVNNSLDRKKVEKIVEDYQVKMADINKCMTFIKQGIENLRKFDLLKMRKHAYNRDFPALNNIYEDGAMMGKAILLNANEIMRVVQIANVAGSTAARAVQIASMATGVLTGLFIGMDIYFVAKDSKELKKGAKSEFAAKIREVATQLHDGLIELNGIRDELQSTDGTAEPEAILDLTKNQQEEKKIEEEKKMEEDSDEDEIDRIKKAIKKDYESREYV